MCKRISFLQHLKLLFGPSLIMAKCMFLVLAGLLASAVVLSCMAFVVGKFNVNRETADVLTLLAPIMGWVLAFVLVAYAIRFQGFRDKALRLLERISRIGSVEFGNGVKLSEEDQKNLSEMISAAVIDAMKNSNVVGKAEEYSEKIQADNVSLDRGSPSQKTEMEKTLDRQARFRNWEVAVLQRHREKYGGVQWEYGRSGCILWNHFDGVISRSGEIVALEVKTVRQGFNPRMSLVNAISSWSSVKDRFLEFEHKRLLLEVLFCADESFQSQEHFAHMVRDCIGVQPSVRVYIYLFNRNDTISKVEEIA